MSLPSGRFKTYCIIIHVISVYFFHVSEDDQKEVKKKNGNISTYLYMHVVFSIVLLLMTTAFFLRDNRNDSFSLISQHAVYFSLERVGLSLNLKQQTSTVAGFLTLVSGHCTKHRIIITM